MNEAKEKLHDLLDKAGDHALRECRNHTSCDDCKYNGEFCESIVSYLIQNGVTLIPETGIGDMSDGYHTFNELYHHS